MAQLMPLPLTVFCLGKIKICSDNGSPYIRAQKVQKKVCPYIRALYMGSVYRA